MALDLAQFQNLGLPEIVLWMLSFAVVYGILSQVGDKGVPQSKASRGIIAIVIAFFVIISAPTSLINFLSSMTSSLVLVLVGLLILMILIEIGGITGTVTVQDEKGNKGKLKAPIYMAYGYLFVIAFIIIVALIFVNSGGLQLLGWNINLSAASSTTVAFFIFIILAVLWMIADKK